MKLTGKRGTWGFWGAVILIFVVGQLLVSTGALNDFWETIILIGGVMAIVSLGLNLIYGFSGQFSLGQWGFYALGAYAAADVTYRWSQLHSASGLVILFMVVTLVGLAYLGIARLSARLQGVDTLSAFALYLVATIVAGVAGVAIGQVLIDPVTALLTALPA